MRQRIYAEQDMIVFGYGGFYEQPKGFGLDLCYFSREEFGFLKSRKAIAKAVFAAIGARYNTGVLAQWFAPGLRSRFQRLVEDEWYYWRAELLYVYARAKLPSMKQFATFEHFAQICIGGKKFCTPEELFTATYNHISRLTPEDLNLMLRGQHYVLSSQLEASITRDLKTLLGEVAGEQLYTAIRNSCVSDPGLQETMEGFMGVLFANMAAQKAMIAWHQHYFSQLFAQPKRIMQTARRLKVKSTMRKESKAAIRDVKRALTHFPYETRALLAAYDIPIFVAHSEDLSWFNHFHEPGSLVHKQDGKLHQMVGLGLCAYKTHASGAILVTRGGRNYERFWHTLAEECTHFADGPANRMTLQGRHRYSGTKEFRQAFEADKASHAPWRNSGVLGAKEWGFILVQRKTPERQRARIQARIEQYEATLNFEHYPQAERMAENFAALPIIEEAVGGKLARVVLPNLFAFYDTVYKPGLKAETAALK